MRGYLLSGYMLLIWSWFNQTLEVTTSQLQPKLLTFPLANNSSWVPVSTHSPALNTTLEKHVKNIQLRPCVLIYAYIHLYMLTYIYIYIHDIIFVVSPFGQKKTSSQLCQIIKSTCIYLISAIFEACQNDNLEVEIIKLMYQVNNTVKMKLCKKGKALKCASRGSRFQVQWLFTLVTCNHGTIRSASFTVDKRCAITLELFMKWHGVDI